MLVTTRFTFDILQGDATFDVLLDGVVVSKWHFQDGSEGIITCLEKSESSSAPYDEAIKALNDMGEWIKFIRNHGEYYKCFNAAKEDYSTEFIRNDDGITCEFKVDGIDYRGSEWDATSDNITYGARPAISWSWGTFLAWHRAGEEFFRMIQDYKATT